jgi:hypothetical protein
MKIAVLQTIAFNPPDLSTVPADVAASCSEADLVLCVYQNKNGEAQAMVMRGTTYTDEVVIHDVV